METRPETRQQPVFSSLIEEAIELAAQWHDQTYRKGRWRDEPFKPPPEEVLPIPVIAHVTAVAFTVQRAGWDDETIAAAFLHDIIEDANRYEQEMRYGELCTLMGQEVADRVREVSEQKYDADGGWRRWKPRKIDYIAHLRTASDEAVAISLADKLHNLWSINETLASGINVFASSDGRRALSAGPAEQRWFFRGVFEATAGHSDPRLDALRERLQKELARFDRITNQQP